MIGQKARQTPSDVGELRVRILYNARVYFILLMVLARKRQQDATVFAAYMRIGVPRFTLFVKTMFAKHPTPTHPYLPS